MFYYRNWDKFCSEIKKSDFTPCRADESLRMDSAAKFIVFKHDVETNVPRALRLAEIEHKYGIRGSYYVQAYLLEDEKNIEILRKMQDMGHEISYHYDVLDASSGDYEKANLDFQKRLKLFNNVGFRFTTICQHGNPVKERIGYTSNRDFFRNQEIRKQYPEMVDMVVDYSQHCPTPYIYISDAGYMWKHITEPETNDLHPDVEPLKIGGFEKLAKYIRNSGMSVVLSTHPHRWEESPMKIYAKIGMFKVVRASVRALQNVPGVKTILNKFYFLAKKI